MGQLELLATSPGLPQAPMDELGAFRPRGHLLRLSHRRDEDGQADLEQTQTSTASSTHPTTAPKTTAFAKSHGFSGSYA